MDARAGRIPEFDSLRAIAAVVVLFFHLDPLRYFAGWTGVDLFFVLSGYLITAIILEEGGSPGFFRAFYARRSLRIWPIYYLTLGTLVVLNGFLAHPGPFADLPYDLTFTQDVPLYWGGKPPPTYPPFDHTWTLAIEEQFYLIWPALVVRAGRRRLVPLCLLTIAVALAARSNTSEYVPNYTERLLVARCDGFALGGLLAWALTGEGWAGGRRTAVAAASGSAVVLASAYLAWGCRTFGPIPFIGLPTPKDPAETIFAFSCLYAGIIGLVAVGSGTRWLAPLRVPGLGALGRISYGLYLYHYVVYWAIDGGRPVPGSMGIGQPWATQATKLLASLAVAVASWHLIERPILRWKDRFRYHRVG